MCEAVTRFTQRNVVAIAPQQHLIDDSSARSAGRRNLSARGGFSFQFRVEVIVEDFRDGAANFREGMEIDGFRDLRRDENKAAVAADVLGDSGDGPCMISTA
jgi:hypothetical protein